MGKGSGRRPTFVSDEEFAAGMARWQTPKPKKEPYAPPPLKGEEQKSEVQDANVA